jgi:hypothetical protein
VPRSSDVRYPGTATLWERPDSKRPSRDPTGAEQVKRGPRVNIQALHNLLRAIRAHYEESIGIALQRASKQHEPFPFKVVHEGGVSGPIRLRFKRLSGLPSSAMRPNYSE